MNFVQLDNKRDGVRLTGAVYTPPTVAVATTALISTMLPERRLRILEPSVGDGAFLDAMFRSLGDNHDYTSIDIDSAVLRELKHRTQLPLSTSQYIAADFVGFANRAIVKNNEKYDLIIGNPPFIRKHNFSVCFKLELEMLAGLIDYPLRDLKNSWTAFLLASERMLSSDGVIVFVLPYELLTVGYGQAALREVLGAFERVDIFVSDEKAFPDIDQDAVVFVARKKTGAASGLFINRVVALDDYSTVREFALDFDKANGDGLALNAFLLSGSAIKLLRRLEKRSNKLGNYAASAPGIVSAANEFFILRQQDAEALGLQDFCLPILKKGSFASASPVFTSASFASIEKDEPSQLIRLTEDVVRSSLAAQAYVQWGETVGYQHRYKCRNRKNWYEVPIVPKEAAFFFKRSHNFPRLCINEGNTYLTDTAYGIRMREGYSVRGLCYSFYNSLTMLFAETNGRFYGGGVLELSPSEFRGLPLVYHEPSDDEFSDFLAAHDRAEGDAEIILDFGDSWLAKKYGLLQNDLVELRMSWRAVRAHRLRHSGRQHVSP